MCWSSLLSEARRCSHFLIGGICTLTTDAHFSCFLIGGIVPSPAMLHLSCFRLPSVKPGGALIQKIRRLLKPIMRCFPVIASCLIVSIVHTTQANRLPVATNCHACVPVFLILFIITIISWATTALISELAFWHHLLLGSAFLTWSPGNSRNSLTIWTYTTVPHIWNTGKKSLEKCFQELQTNPLVPANMWMVRGPVATERCTSSRRMRQGLAEQLKFDMEFLDNGTVFQLLCPREGTHGWWVTTSS